MAPEGPVHTPADADNIGLHPDRPWMEWLDGPPDATGALVFLAFPSVGHVASIAGQYLANSLTLPLVGSLWLPGMAPIVGVDSGRVVSPMRIYGGEVVCQLPEGCPRLFVIHTHLAVTPEVHEEVVDGILAWAATSGVRLVIGIDAVVRQPGDETPDVWAVGRSPEVLAMLAQADLKAMPRGLLTGITAALLSPTNMEGMPGRGAVLVEALSDQPDGLAAVALVEALDRLVPQVDVDAKPLLEEAIAMEEEMQRQEALAKREAPAGTGTFI